MGKNKGGGNKKKKQVNKDQDDLRKPIIFKDELQMYAKAIKSFGSCRFEVLCEDGHTRLAHVRGNMRKKVWIRVGNIVLVSIREYQDSRVDIISRYHDHEVATLVQLKELSNEFVNSSNIDLQNDENNISKDKDNQNEIEFDYNIDFNEI